MYMNSTSPSNVNMRISTFGTEIIVIQKSNFIHLSIVIKNHTSDS